MKRNQACWCRKRIKSDGVVWGNAMRRYSTHSQFNYTTEIHLHMQRRIPRTRTCRTFDPFPVPLNIVAIPALFCVSVDMNETHATENFRGNVQLGQRRFQDADTGDSFHELAKKISTRKNAVRSATADTSPCVGMLLLKSAELLEY